ncbi:MAG: gamma-glutamyl-gamma-aminobutyrate hydrolase family protein [Erysipelotrichaceae bacterium]|nr:gamma-glutamyl-gamma-aminobutyrate hydrolase family protein [Erysipelotrichaceae bacterium]
MKKIIGVMPLWDDEKESIWMLPGYLEGIKEAGALTMIFPLTEDKDEIRQLCKMCDGFLFTGGHDVGTDVYHEEALPQMGIPCKIRDHMEKEVLDYAIENDVAVLGICRGIQFINAALGGSLYQDLPTQHPSPAEHHMSPPYDRICHQVKIHKDSKLYELLKTENIGVNSYHHQAVKELSSSLKCMAVSEDGLVEAVCMPSKRFIWAIQWHPEFSYKVDENSKKIFAEFVRNCK